MAKKDSSLDLIVIRGIIKQKPLSEYHDFFSGTNLKKQIRLETLTNHVLDLFKIDCINAKGNDKTIVKYLNAIEIIIGHYSAKDTKIDKNLEARLVEARTNLKEMLESEGRTLTEEMEELLEKTWKWSIGANLVFPNMEAPEEEVQEETEVTNEEVELLKQKVQETEEELKQTKKELSKSLRSNTKVEGKVTSLESMISELREKNKTQKEEVDSKEKEIKASKKEITKLNEEIEALLRLKAELEEQTSRVESQERTIEEQASELKVLREKDKSIDDLEELEDKIIELVSAKEYTLDELEAILANDNKRLSLMELKKSIKRY